MILFLTLLFIYFFQTEAFFNQKYSLISKFSSQQQQIYLTTDADFLLDTEDVSNFRSGFVAILGNPNMGKSTLMNQLLEEDLCIISSKPQTTRHRILGILTKPHEYQLVFSDTPGMLKPSYQLQETMQEAVRGAAGDADIILLVTDVYGESLVDEEVMNKLVASRKPIIIAVNKVDLAPDYSTWQKFMNQYQNFTSNSSCDIYEQYDTYYRTQYNLPPASSSSAAAASTATTTVAPSPPAVTAATTAAASPPAVTAAATLSSTRRLRLKDKLRLKRSSSKQSSIKENNMMEGLTKQSIASSSSSDTHQPYESNNQKERKKKQQFEIKSLFEIQQIWKQRLQTAEIIGVSAIKQYGIDLILNRLLLHTHYGPQYFPTDTLTNRNERFFCTEIIRETLFKLYKDEIPYSCEVVIDSFHDKSTHLSIIEAGIIVSRKSQQGILIGTGGLKLKELGSYSRKKLEEFLQRKVFLSLRVRVDKDWRSKKESLTKYGYLNSDFS